MEVAKWLEEVSYIGVSDINGDDGKVYYSNFDKSYITHVGMEKDDGLLKFMAENEITHELTHGVGFSHKDNKWYGWSHRAIFGFTIGSECKKGDCGYVGTTPEDLIEDRYDFFVDISEECAQQHKDECQILEDSSGIRILTTPIKLAVAQNMDDLVDAIDGEVTLVEETLFKDDFYTVKCGRGAWTAKTLDDAKLMAIDFNEGVS